MKLKYLNIDCGREPMVFLNANSPIVKKEGFIALNRVAISNGNETVYATLSIMEESDLLKDDELGISKSVFNKITNKNSNHLTFFFGKFFPPDRFFHMIYHNLKI